MARVRCCAVAVAPSEGQWIVPGLAPTSYRSITGFGDQCDILFVSPAGATKISAMPNTECGRGRLILVGKNGDGLSCDHHAHRGSVSRVTPR